MSKKEAIIQIFKYHMKQSLIYKIIKFFRIQNKKMQSENLLRYLWSLDESGNGLCERTEVAVDEETECDYCGRKHEIGSKMSRLYNIENESAYYLCIRCANETTTNVFY